MDGFCLRILINILTQGQRFPGYTADFSKSPGNDVKDHKADENQKSYPQDRI